MASSLPSTDKITAAVITGGHEFDVPGFHAIFRSFSNVDGYIQHVDDFVADVANVRRAYDVIIFYHLFWKTPDGKLKDVLEQLGSAGQGIVLLHHAILAYRQWPLWSELVGIPDRSFQYHMDQQLHINVADADHPITRGLEKWTMVDETYEMDSTGPDSQILLTVDHPKSMHTIAWTRQFQKCRVFCIQSGHDNQTYLDPSFRTVIHRGIRWCAGR